MSEVLKATLIANCIIWMLVTLLSLRDAISVYRFFSHTRPGFKSYILFQMCYFVGTLLLGVFSVGITIMHPEIIASNSLYLFVLLSLGIAALLANHFYQKSLAGSDGVVDLLAINQYFIYLSESKGKKNAAARVKPEVPSKYLYKTTLKARVLQPTIRYMMVNFGEQKTVELLGQLEMPIDYILYHDSDINIEFSNDLFDALMVKTGRGQDVIFEAQASGANLQCMGAMFFLVARVLSIHQIYKTICRLSHFLDENFANEIIQSEKNSIVMRCYFKDASLIDRFNELCVYSIAGWTSSIPNLKGLPHAKVEVLNSPFAQKNISREFIEFRISWVNHISDAAEFSKMTYSKDG